jgi:hypothetical protein
VPTSDYVPQPPNARRQPQRVAIRVRRIDEPQSVHREKLGKCPSPAALVVGSETVVVIEERIVRSARYARANPRTGHGRRVKIATHSHWAGNRTPRELVVDHTSYDTTSIIATIERRSGP